MTELDDEPVVYEDDGVDLWPLKTRRIGRSSEYRVVWLLLALPGSPTAYARALRVAWDLEHDPAGLGLWAWGRRNVTVALRVQARGLASAVRVSHRALFQLVMTAGQQVPPAVVIFVAGRGVRFSEIERRWRHGE